MQSISRFLVKNEIKSEFGTCCAYFVVEVPLALAKTAQPSFSSPVSTGVSVNLNSRTKIRASKSSKFRVSDPQYRRVSPKRNVVDRHPYHEGS